MSDDNSHSPSDEAAEEPPPSSASRRRDTRFQVEASITLESEHNLYAGFVENLSVSGVFIATHSLRRIGEQVEFSLRLGEREDTIAGVAEVRWIREYSETSDSPPGMGLRFVELDANSQAHLETFIRSREPLFFDDD